MLQTGQSTRIGYNSSCAAAREAPSSRVRASAAGMGGSSSKQRCVFCNLYQDAPERILYQDDLVFAFHDRRPAARLHILVCPLPAPNGSHIANTNSLRGPQDATLLRHMRKIGEQVLLQQRDAAAPAAAALAPARQPATPAVHGSAARRSGGDGSGDGLCHRLCCCLRRLRPRRGSGGLLGNESGWDHGWDEEGGGPEAATSRCELLFGFHKPPWRSVDHLHMHCFLLPLKPQLAWKYRWGINWITAEALEQKLRGVHGSNSGSSGGLRG